MVMLPMTTSPSQEQGPQSGSQSVQAGTLYQCSWTWALPAVAARGQSSRGNKVFRKETLQPLLWPSKCSSVA